MRGVGRVLGNLAAQVETTKVALAAYAQMQAAPKLQNTAQSDAPWHDRSGKARAGLKAGTFMRGNKIIIYLAHQVSYGVYLELAHDQKYAVIDPTMDKCKDEIFEGYKRIMRM